jgi:dCTP deaminase
MLKANEIAKRLKLGAKAGEADLDESLANDPMVIDPLVIIPMADPDELAASGSASIDLRLGTWFVSLRQARMSHLEVDAPSQNIQFSKTHYVPFGESYYLHPRSFVLATTLEWLRLPCDIAAYVIGRSSWGRRGLIIATATGVHPGFTGCLTLEITNVGEIPIAIKPGMAICQLFFHEVIGPETSSIDRSQFAGSRKPTVGRIRPDNFFRKLTNRPQVAWILSQYKLLLADELDQQGRLDKSINAYNYLDEESKEYVDSLPLDERLSIESQLQELVAKTTSHSDE